MDYTNGGTWRTAGSLPTSRYGLKAASIDGQLYVSKISDMYPSKWRENIQETWCAIKLMLMNSTLSWNQVMGGNQNTEFAATDEILSWEPISETWTEFDLKLSTKRAYHAVAEVDLNTISNASCWSQIYPAMIMFDNDYDHRWHCDCRSWYETTIGRSRSAASLKPMTKEVWRKSLNRGNIVPIIF